MKGRTHNFALPQVGAWHCNFSYNWLSTSVWGL